MPTLNIFISHKHEDEIAARGIKAELIAFGAREIQVFLSCDDIAYGDNWLKAIQNTLTSCNLLLLLFTDKKASWDWCLYEAGMFTRLDEVSYKRVICLYSPDLEEPPGPLKHLQAIKATVQNIETFLKKLYRTTTYVPDSQPIAPELQDAHIEPSARRIFAHMTKTPRDSQHLLKEICLHVDDINKISLDQIPADAKVIADQTSLELFNKRPGAWSWKDLEEEANKNTDQRWVKQLAKAIYQASRRTATDPVFATFTARDSSKLYQPILNSVEWERDGSIKFQILFNDEVTWRLPDIPDNLAVIHTAQSMALRFRYEVLRKYASSLGRKSRESLREVLSELHEVISSIEQESASRGLLEEPKLLTVFKPDQRPKIQQMYADWYAVRAELLEALREMETDRVKRCLSRLEVHNSQFIPMAADRYGELIAEAMRDEGTFYTEERLVRLSRKPLNKKSQMADLSPSSRKHLAAKLNKSNLKPKENASRNESF